MKLAVLGAGSVGRLIARDLVERFNATVVLLDGDRDALAEAERFGAETHTVDVTGDSDWLSLLKGASCVVSTLPSEFGFATLQRLINAGNNVVDLSFMPDNFLELHGLAQEKGVSVVADMGVAPGISHVLTTHLAGQLSEVHAVNVYAGALPLERDMPWQYKSPFAPYDAIENYTRPARYRAGGQLFEVPALSQRELLHASGIGSLEGALTDGLRSLLSVDSIPSMTFKTLRFPGSFNLLIALREAGFFSSRPLHLGDTVVEPLDVTTTLLSEAWSLLPDDEEFTFLRVDVHGLKGNKSRVLSAQLCDFTNTEREESSIARTTGIPAAIVAAMMVQGEWNQPGVFGPEALGQDAEVAEAFFQALDERDVFVTFDEMGA